MVNNTEPLIPPKNETDDKSGNTRFASLAKLGTLAIATANTANNKLLTLANIFATLLFLFILYMNIYILCMYKIQNFANDYIILNICCQFRFYWLSY